MLTVLPASLPCGRGAGTGASLSTRPGFFFSQVLTPSCSWPSPAPWIAFSRLVSCFSVSLKFFSQLRDLGSSLAKPLRATVWMLSPLPQAPFGSLSFFRSYLLYAQCGDHSVHDDRLLLRDATLQLRQHRRRELTNDLVLLVQAVVLEDLVLEHAHLPALDSMPMILPPNSLALALEVRQRVDRPSRTTGRVSSSDVGPYQAPRSSSWSCTSSSTGLCVVGSQASVWKSMSPRGERRCTAGRRRAA